MENDLSKELEFIRDQIYDEKDLDLLKEEIKPIAAKFKELTALKKDLEAKHEIEMKEMNKKVLEYKEKLRSMWAPFVHSDKSEMVIDGMKLKIETVLDATIADKGLAIEWLESNDMKDVMKFDIHTATLKALAKDLYKEGREISGLKYSKFQNVSVK